MFQATADAAPSTAKRTDHALVPAEETVAPEVKYENRSATDKWWGLVYLFSLIAYIACGSYMVSQSHNRYEFDESSGQRQISAHFMDDAVQCCSDPDANNLFGVCAFIGGNDGRRLAAGNSTFVGDEGIFDAFLDAPEIIVGLIALSAAIGLTWVVLLRFFATPIVILVELCKIAIFIVMGIYQVSRSSQVMCFAIAAGILLYDIWARNKLIFAAKIISHSTIAMKENMSIFVGGIAIKVLFAGITALFIFFFAESFNVVEVKKITYDGYYNSLTYCEFASPKYVTGIDTYLSLSYLWSILLFDKMRLSMIATVIGSWHFHPEKKPSIFVAMKNIAPSFGTLSVASLIATVAEYVNKVTGEEAWKSWVSPFVCVTAPLNLLMCCFGACLKTLVQMFTKFAVILHVFTGDAFVGSGKKVFKILKRHFKGGFVTEVTSKSVLSFGSYAFSLGIAMVAWKWIDDRFDCGTLSQENTDNQLFFILYILMICVNVWYPVLGIYVLILLSKILQDAGKKTIEQGDEGWNHSWIPPVSAAFIACIVMILFQFLSAIFLDVIDTLFLCFAIDKDNGVDLSNDEFTALIQEVPEYTDASSTDSLLMKQNDPENQYPIAVPAPTVTA